MDRERCAQIPIRGRSTSCVAVRSHHCRPGLRGRSTRRRRGRRAARRTRSTRGGTGGPVRCPRLRWPAVLSACARPGCRVVAPGDPGTRPHPRSTISMTVIDESGLTATLEAMDRMAEVAYRHGGAAHPMSHPPPNQPDSTSEFEGVPSRGCVGPTPVRARGRTSHRRGHLLRTRARGDDRGVRRNPRRSACGRRRAAGRVVEHPKTAGRSNRLLRTISVGSLTFFGISLMGIALVRGRWHLALGVGAVIAGSNITTQVYKGWCTVRIC